MRLCVLSVGGASPKEISLHSLMAPADEGSVIQPTACFAAFFCCSFFFLHLGYLGLVSHDAQFSDCFSLIQTDGFLLWKHFENIQQMTCTVWNSFQYCSYFIHFLLFLKKKNS